jgi:hypothetical protein
MSTSTRFNNVLLMSGFTSTKGSTIPTTTYIYRPKTSLKFRKLWNILYQNISEDKFPLGGIKKKAHFRSHVLKLRKFER